MLDDTGNLSGATGGVGLDDIFDLVGVTANWASVNGSNQLVVTDNGTTVDTPLLIVAAILASAFPRYRSQRWHGRHFAA